MTWPRPSSPPRPRATRRRPRRARAGRRSSARAATSSTPRGRRTLGRFRDHLRRCPDSPCSPPGRSTPESPRPGHRPAAPRRRLSETRAGGPRGRSTSRRAIAALGAASAGALCPLSREARAGGLPGARDPAGAILSRESRGYGTCSKRAGAELSARLGAAAARGSELTVSSRLRLRLALGLPPEVRKIDETNDRSHSRSRGLCGRWMREREAGYVRSRGRGTSRSKRRRVERLEGLPVGSRSTAPSSDGSRLSCRAGSRRQLPKSARCPGKPVRAGAVLVRLSERETEERARWRACGTLTRGARRRRARPKEPGSVTRSWGRRVRRPRSWSSRGRGRRRPPGQRSLRRGRPSGAEADLGQSVLIAPFDASSSRSRVGRRPRPPRTALVRLASRTGRRVEADTGEEEVADVFPGAALVESLAEEGRGRYRDAWLRSSGRRPEADVADPGRSAGGRRAGGLVRALLLPGPRRRGCSCRCAPSSGAAGSTRRRSVPTEGRCATPDRRPLGRPVEVRSGLAAGERVVLDPPRTWEPAREGHDADPRRAPAERRRSAPRGPDREGVPRVEAHAARRRASLLLGAFASSSRRARRSRRSRCR